MIAPPPANPGEDATLKLLTLAQTLHEVGWLAKAEETYRNLLRDQPVHAQALYRLGLLRNEQGDHSEAMALLHASIAAAPDAACVHFALGRMLIISQDAVAAAERYKRAAALEPGNIEVLASLGILRLWEQCFDDAVKYFHRALTIVPDEPSVLRHLAGVFLIIGNPRAAEACVRKALAVVGTAEGHTALGNALHAQERHSEAAEAYECAVALRPNSVEAHLGLASSLEAVGRRDDAVRHLCGAATVLTDAPEELLRIGKALFDLGDETAAQAVYGRFSALTADRKHYPGCPPRCVAVRPAADACRKHGWPYRTLAPSETIRVAGGDGTPYSYRLPEVFLAYAEDAVIVPALYAPLVGNDTLLVDGFNTNSRVSLPLIPHLVWHSPDERMLIDLPEPSRTIEEEAILLGGGVNWSHGVLDWMSKLAVLERTPELDHLPVLVAGNMLRSILDLAELLGLERSRMIPLTPGEVVRGRRLWLPSLTHNYQYTSPMHVEFLRRRLAGPIAEGLARPRRRIFLSRRQAGYRALLNEVEVLAALMPLGVEPVVPEDLPMAEQIALFASAELIVGPIGGGSAAIVFAQPGTAYVELVHRRIALPQYNILTGLLGQRYRQIVGEARSNRSVYVFDHDFTVSPIEVETEVRALLGL